MVNAIETASVTPVFRKVAECLYRHSPTGINYGLVEKSGRQFRKSFKTTDRKLADRTLAEFRQKVGRLTRRDNLGKVTFAELASIRPWSARQPPASSRWAAARMLT